MGDGCGIAFDSRIIKGTTPKKFEDFWRSDNVPAVLKSNAIIGHDRKASVGAQTFENTQPICFSDINVILAHNGTIFNYKEMHAAHKVKDHFDYNITGMSDSQVMALLIEKSGWKVLEEYIGTMAFLLMNTTDPGAVYAYHGKSNLRKYSAIESEERPLYYGVEDGRTWFCSTKPPLEKIIKTRANIYELPFNQVIRFDGEGAKIVAEIDRSKAVQIEDYVAPKWTGTQYSTHDDYDDYETYYRNAGKAGKVMNLPERVRNIEDDVFISKTSDSLYWEAGYFKVNEEKADGLVRVTSSGRIWQEDRDKHAILYNFYFHAGNLVKDEESYIGLIETICSDEWTKEGPFRKMTMVGRYLAMPFIIEIPVRNGSTQACVYSSSKADDSKIYFAPFSGIIPVVFSAKEIKIVNGMLGSISTETYSGIAPIARYNVVNPNPEKISAAITAVLSRGLESSKEDSEPIDELHTCPICLGWGSFMEDLGCSDQECVACDGKGSILKSTLEAYLESDYNLDSEMLNLDIEHTKSLVKSLIIKAMDRGMDILDESSTLDAIQLSEKINELKVVLWEEC